MDYSETTEMRVKLQIEDLRQNTLTLFLSAVLIVPFLWLLHVTKMGYQGGIPDAAALVAMGTAGLTLGLKRKHLAVAAWIYILGGCLAQSLLLRSYPGSIIVIFAGALLIIVANAVLGAPHGLVAAMAVTLGEVLALDVSRSLAFVPPGPLEVLAVNILIWGASYLAGRPLETTTYWSLTGWQQTRDLLAETRRRREELYRVIRSLEEASYRIERMNNELLLAKHQADEARAFKSRLAAMVSHELRAPLNLILGFSQLIALYPEKYGEPLPPAYYADIDVIYRNSQHLVALIDDILDLSRIEAERLPLVKDRVEFRTDIVEKVVAAVGGLAERKGLYLRQQVPDDLPWLLADPVRIRQTLTNLLINAIRFTDSGGITVRVACDDHALVASVEDTGVGISKEHLPKLFQEFTQVTQTKTRESAGTGLGLVISKQLVELHGGKIWVESEIGRGTTIHFSLPLPDVPDATAPHVTPSHARAKPHQVCLVVHDNPEFVRLIARYVERYHLVGVSCKQSVADMVQELHPCAVITSPRLRGQVKRQLSRLPYEVALISVNSESPNGGWATIRGVNYMSKPVTIDMLRAVMSEMDHGQEMTILVADDDPDFVRLLTDMLTLLPHRYQILRAYDGQQALEIMQGKRPDLVFLDLVMPRLTGEETLQAMRQNPQLADVPVVVVSAKTVEQTESRIAPPIALHLGPMLDAAEAAKLLTALLDTANSCYLPAVEAA